MPVEDLPIYAEWEAAHVLVQARLKRLKAARTIGHAGLIAHMEAQYRDATAAYEAVVNRL